MEFRILGRLEVIDDGVDVAPRRAQPRVVLAMLLLHSNEVVSTDRLVDALWGDSPPPTADKALQGHVSILRKALGFDRFATERGGYRLAVQPGELDADRFSDAVAGARTVPEASARARALGDALAMWRGDALADLGSERALQPEIARLAGIRLAAVEAWAEAEVAAGNHSHVLAELERLVAEHPLSEGLRADLMLALYRAGRQSDALRSYREGRRVLAEELGIDPGTQLQVLERQILAHDPGLDLAILPVTAQAPRQERKTVTVLVVEVVPAGATDPEDLEEAAQPALERIRMLVEQVGGRAEPLFANALVGLFGAPRAHDDDALRAVRTALELLGGTVPGVELRGGIETGEALVTIDGDDVSITGQVLGAASRLQVNAPVGTILVGPATHDATDAAIDYQGSDAGAWKPRRVRRPDEVLRPEPPFVGRGDELGQLERIFARARDGGSVQLVTITAEPGGGKSRLIRELRSRVEAGTAEAVDSEVTPRWLQGRCLPYGNGLTFWALGEIVKEWAGILESDDASASADKLAAALAALEPEDNRRTWLARSAAPLAGIDDAAASGDREQGFAAWRQLIEAIAATQPLVVAFEDVHWADEALLTFIDHLVEHAADAPILVVCTARPELFEAHPTWGAGRRNATNLLLQPLSEADTGRLLQALLGREAAPDTVRRAGGNPLYAHELARLVAEPGTEARPIPASLQAVIAAHLDALTPELKVAATNAAVVGEVFWPGVVAEIGGVEAAVVESRLHRLVANEVIRRRRRSAVAGQDEYEFLHVLVRDVAYGQIPRRDRIAKHRAAAAWIERLAEDRPTAHAELASHHYVEALELAQRLGDHEQVPGLRSRAVASLALAGDGARTLDVAKAESLYRRALALSTTDEPGRGRVLGRLGVLTQYIGRADEAERLCQEAIAALVQAGEDADAAAVMVSLVSILWRLGRPDEERRQLLLGAIRILEAREPGAELVNAYCQMAALELYEGRAPGTLDWARKAISVAGQLAIPVLQLEPLHYHGIARFEMGDVGGIDDIRASVQLGLEAGLSWEVGLVQTDLAATLWLSEGPGAGLAAKQFGAQFCSDRGLPYLERTTRAESLWLQYDAGEWDAVVAGADALIAWEQERGPGRLTTIAKSAKARVLASRGAVDEALELGSEVLARARAMGDSQDLVPAYATGAAIHAAAAQGENAVLLIRELADAMRDRDPSKRAHELPTATRVAVAFGAADVARAMIPEGEPNYLRSRLCIAAGRAILAESDGALEEAAWLYAEAAEGLAAYGWPFEEAHAHVGSARSLISLGRAAAAGAPLVRARNLATGLRAEPMLEEISRLESAIAIPA
ncbi:MAG TPA: BTAD domain-containing putative transcriptional regulator [Candidatus Limnocylindrales bacterium]|nr:BTAD domain-containing putative transcriptional regulator [Candidatus Limnocylindrales bacterium]